MERPSSFPHDEVWEKGGNLGDVGNKDRHKKYANQIGPDFLR